MKKIKFLTLALCASAILSSCSMTMPLTATSNSIGPKVGQASGNTFLNALYFWADFSIKTAAQNGGIKKISTVDVKKSDILGIIQTYTTIVTGE